MNNSKTNSKEAKENTLNASFIAHISAWWKEKISWTSLPKEYKTVIQLGVFLLILAFTFGAIQLARTLISRAAAGTVRISITPTTLAIPPDSTAQIWMNADSPVAFAHVEITFPPSQIQLSQEVSLTSGLLTRIVKRTSMAEANSTGKITLAVGLDPTHRDTPPNGSFQFATLHFSPVANAQGTATIAVIPNSSLVIDPTASIFSITTTNCTITVNATTTPTSSVPTATPHISPTSFPNSTPTTKPSIIQPTNTPTRRPTATPIPIGSCLPCYKRTCDAICDPKKEKTTCKDCSLYTNPRLCLSCEHSVCDHKCTSRDRSGCPDCTP